MIAKLIAPICIVRYWKHFGEIKFTVTWHKDFYRQLISSTKEKFWYMKSVSIIFDTSSRIPEKDTNRVERHGGQMMRVYKPKWFDIISML